MFFKAVKVVNRALFCLVILGMIFNTGYAHAAKKKKLKEYIKEERKLCFQTWVKNTTKCINESMEREVKVDEKKFYKGDPDYKKCIAKEVKRRDKCQNPKTLKKRAKLAKETDKVAKKLAVIIAAREKRLDVCNTAAGDCYYDCRKEKGKAFKKCAKDCEKELKKCTKAADKIADKEAKKAHKIK